MLSDCFCCLIEDLLGTSDSISDGVLELVELLNLKFSGFNLVFTDILRFFKELVVPCQLARGYFFLHGIGLSGLHLTLFFKLL